MTRRVIPFSSALLSVAALVLAGCEQHAPKATRGAPEYLHEALSGDVPAQKNLIECYGSHDACGGLYPFDPALSCAWRGVRLASQAPDLTLVDEAAFTNACAQGDATFQQRLRLAQEDLTRRIYRTAAPIHSAAGPAVERLYPSIEAVRGRMNSVLAKAHAAPLPAFGASLGSQDSGRRIWKTCSPTVCLEGIAPGWGGGLHSYRATVISATKPGHDRELAADLVGAGLEAPAIAADLLTPVMFSPPRSFPAAGVCWSAGTLATGQPFAGATPGPC